MSLIIAIIAWLHVGSAISWLGGGIMFAFIIGPALAKLSPTSSGEFLVKVVPRVVLFFQVMAASTVLFGVLLIYSLGGNSFSLLSPSTFYGVDLIIGLSIGFITFLISEGVAVPIQLKAIRMIKNMQASGQHQPPAEFPKTLKRAADTATLTVYLLIITLVFMIAAGFY
jgi:uncharacterized membrane protein